MSQDVLDVYQQICEKALTWLTGPLSKRDFAPIIRIMGSRVSKKMAGSSLARVRRMRVAMRSVRGDIRRKSEALAVRAGSFLFAVTAIGLSTVASSRAFYLSRRFHQPPLSGVVKQPRRRNKLRALEMTLWFAIVGILGYCSFVYATAAEHQAQRTDLVNNFRNEALKPSAISPILPPLTTDITNEPADEGKLLGFLDIPRIGLSSVVEEGSGPRILLRGVGHMPGTALPGEHGNIGLAGHLDAYFAELSNLKTGDIVTFRSMNKVYDYGVVSAFMAASLPPNANSSAIQSTLTLVNYSRPSEASSNGKQLVIIAREVSQDTDLAQ